MKFQAMRFSPRTVLILHFQVQIFFSEHPVVSFFVSLHTKKNFRHVSLLWRPSPSSILERLCLCVLVELVVRIFHPLW
jgi:hypothetical protein